ncbi:MAG: polysaccharide deacetylase family protein [Trebonia sp.]
MTAEPGTTRRVLLTAGGLTLLAGCSTSATTAAHPLAAGTETRPAAQHLSVKHQSSTSSPTAAGHPSGHGPDRRKPTPVHTRPVYYIHDGPKAIALTIDDGPSPVYTPQILRLLARYHVTASFSMIGVQVDEYQAVARDVAAAGHVIMNHTWQHLDLPTLPPKAARRQIDRATEAIHRVTGQVPAFFRAPYGAWSPSIMRYLATAGMTPVDWSVDPRDWARPGVYAIEENILRNTGTGSIILEHDGGGDRSQTVAALRYVIPRLLDAGYHFHAL